VARREGGRHLHRGGVGVGGGRAGEGEALSTRHATRDIMMVVMLMPMAQITGHAIRGY
jgi:hypothetical protein